VRASSPDQVGYLGIARADRESLYDGEAASPVGARFAAGVDGAPAGVEVAALADGSQTRDSKWYANANRQEANEMPRGDRTGPMGWGPMTGRAAGYCAGYDAPGFANDVPGRGFGLGRGGGRGHGWRWRHWAYATGLPDWTRVGRPFPWGYGPYPGPITQQEEVESLKAQAGWLEEQLDAVNRCLAELEKEE